MGVSGCKLLSLGEAVLSCMRIAAVEILGICQTTLALQRCTERARMAAYRFAFRPSNSRALCARRRNLANLSFVRVPGFSTRPEAPHLITGHLTGHSFGPDISNSPDRP